MSLFFCHGENCQHPLIIVQAKKVREEIRKEGFKNWIGIIKGRERKISIYQNLELMDVQFISLINWP